MTGTGVAFWLPGYLWRVVLKQPDRDRDYRVESVVDVPLFQYLYASYAPLCTRVTNKHPKYNGDGTKK